MKKSLLVTIALGLVLAAGAVWYTKSNQQADLPTPQNHDDFTNPNPTPSPTPTPNSTSLPEQVNLKVSFTSQAPHAKWVLPYKEFCEEASALMAASYVLNQPITSKEDADAKLLAIKDFEDRTFGYYLDTTAAETAKILTDFYDIKDVVLVDNPTILQIKQALASGKVVLVPAAGQQLPNPNYVAPGPPYHMIVIKGYTKDGKFITNDPGTRNGADFIFDQDDVMRAMHDWNEDDIYSGKKVVIVVG